MKDGEHVHYWEFGCECGHVMFEETDDKAMIGHKTENLFNEVIAHVAKPHKFKIGDYVIRSMFENMGLHKKMNIIA